MINRKIFSIRYSFFLMLFYALAAATPIYADVPRTMSFQGLLLDDTNTPLTGTSDLTINIYDVENSGVALYSEVHTNVALDNGVYSIVVGSVAAGGISDAVIAAAEIWLGVSVDGGSELPRLQVTSTPWSIKSLMAEKLVEPGSATDALVVDPGGNVGIGLAAPDEKLHVDGTVKATAFAGDGSQLTGLSPNSLESADGAIADAVFVDAAGNVGFGTTSPAGPFEIVCDDCADPVLDQSNEIVTGFDIANSFWQSFTAGVTGRLSQIDLRNDSGGGNAATLRVYVGEGIAGALLLTEEITLGPDAAFASYNLSTLPAMTAGEQYTFEFSSEMSMAPSRDNTNTYAGGVSSLSGTKDVNFRSWVIPAVTTLVVDSDGNVGIGADAPAEALEVSGNVLAAKFIGDGSMLTDLPDDGDWIVDGDDVYRTAGNVGLGTDSPSELLHVVDTATAAREVVAKFQLSDAPADFLSIENNDIDDNYFGPMLRGHNESSTDSPGIFIQGSTSAAGDTGTAPLIRMSASQDFSAPVANRDILSIKNHQTELFRIDNAGNVGIGTPTPSAPLTVISPTAVTDPTVIIQSINDNGTATEWRNSVEAPIARVSQSGAFVGSPATSDFPAFSFLGDFQSGMYSPEISNVAVSTNSVERMRIDEIGNVGINNTSPAEKLDIVGNIAVSGTVDGIDIGDHAADPNAHHTPPTTLPPSGNAGGDLSGTYPDPSVVNDSHTHGDGTIAADISIDNGRLYAPAGAGNVGIGTTTPDSTLQVAGDARITGELQVDGGISGELGIGLSDPMATLHLAGTTAVFSKPSLLAELTDEVGGFAKLHRPKSVFVSGTLAYVVAAGNDDSLTIIDVSNPAIPLLLSETSDGDGMFTQLDGAESVFVSGTIAYVAATDDDSVTIIDVSVPTSPVWLAHLTDGVGLFTELDAPRSVFVAGTTAYIASEGDSSLTIVDVSVPGSPVWLAHVRDGDGLFTKLAGAKSVHVSGTTAYVAAFIDASLTMIDVSTPASPTWLAHVSHGIGDFTSLNGANSVFALGTAAYVASTTSDSLTIIDVSIPTSPQLLAAVVDEMDGYTKLDGADDVFVTGTTVYAVSNIDNAMTIIDVSSPASPRLLAEVSDEVDGFTKLDVATSVFVSGTTAYVTSFNDDSLTVIDAGVGLAELIAESNVGIGTATPLSKLEIQGEGNTSATSALNVTNSDGFSKFYVGDDGNVGIGTDAPEDLLTVAGDVGVAGNINSSGLVNGRDVNADGIKLDGIATGAADTTNDSWTGTTDVSVTTGNVGIRTGSPESSLHIANTIATIPNGPTATGIHMGADGAGAPTIQLYSPEVGSVIDFTDGAGEDADWRIIAGASNLSLGATIGANGIDIDTAGNIGIGTDSPMSALHLLRTGETNLTVDRVDDTVSPANIDVRKARGSVGSLMPVLFDDDIGGLDMWGYDGSDYSRAAGIRAMVEGNATPGVVPGRLEFSTTDFSGTTAERMRISPTGKVSIGNDGVLSTLNVGGNVTVSSSSSYLAAVAPPNGMIVEGDVGIGTTLPSAKLDVVGNAEISGNLTVAGEIDGTLSVGVSGRDAAVHLSGSTGFVDASLIAEILDEQAGFGKLLNPQQVFVSGTKAYVAGENALTIVDITTPSSPTLINEIVDDVGDFTDLEGANSVFVSGTTAYVTASTANALTIIDVSDPMIPTELAVIKDGVGGYDELAEPFMVFVNTAGTTAYVASAGDNAITIIDVATPGSPSLHTAIVDNIGGFNNLGEPYIEVHNTLAYVVSATEHALSIIDVNSPASPVLRSVVIDDNLGVNDLAGAFAVTVSDTVAYVTAREDNALSIFDVTNPISPQLLSVVKDDVGGFTKLDGAAWVTVANNKAYVSAIDDHAITIIDVSNPSSPRLMAEIVDDDGVFNNLGFPIGMDVDGSTLYVAASNDSALNIIDTTTTLVDIITTNNVGIGTDEPSEMLELGSGGNIDLNAGSLTLGQLAAPSNVIATATTGGTLQSSTRFFVVTAVNANGETMPSSEVSAMVDGSTTTAIQINWDAVEGATSYRIYHGTSSGSQTEYFVDSDGSPYLYTSDVAGSAGAPPSFNTTGGDLTVTGITNIQSLNVVGDLLVTNDIVHGGTAIFSGLVQVKGPGTTGATAALNVTDSASTSALFVRDDGHVGLGTTSPDVELHIEGTPPDLRLTYTPAISTLDKIASIQFEANDGDSMEIGAAIRAFADSTWGASAPTTLEFYTQDASAGTGLNAPRMVIDSQGEVGIGTDQPEVTLDLRSTNPILRMYDNNNADGSNAFIEFGQIGGGVFDRTGFIGDASTGDRNLHIGADSGFNIQMSAGGQSTVTNPHLVVADDGDIGIGTTDPVPGDAVPSRTLQLKSPAGSRAVVNLQPGSGSAGQSFVRFSGASTGGWAVGRSVAATDNHDFFIHDFEAGATRMAIDSAGDVGIGTTDPDFPLTVVASSSGHIARFYNSENSGNCDGVGIQLNNTAPTTGNSFISFWDGNGSIDGHVTSDGSGGITYSTTSDRRLKENIRQTHYGLADVMSVRVQDFNYKGMSLDTTGFIAQDLYEIYPVAVRIGGEDPNEDPWSVDYGKLTPLLVQAIQDLKSEKDDENAVLRKECESLRNELAASDATIAAQGAALSRVNTRMAEMERNMKRLEELLALKLEIDAARALADGAVSSEW